MKFERNWQHLALVLATILAALIALIRITGILETALAGSGNGAPIPREAAAMADRQLHAGWNPSVWEPSGCVTPDIAFSNLIQQGVLNIAGEFLPEIQRWEVYDVNAPPSLNTLTSVCGNDLLWLHVSQATTWTQSTEAPPADPKPENVTAEERDLYRLVNEYRVISSQCYDTSSQSWRGWLDGDSVRLALSPTLTRAAHDYAQWMADNNWFSHVDASGNGPWERVVLSGYRGFSWVAEVIAAGQRTADAALEGWRNSDGHNRVVLACQARAVGVGYGYNPNARYETRWVANFGNHVDSDLA